MSATVYYEPHKLPAGILALAVHSVFFALLYFGFNWHRQPFSSPTMSVELWRSLPEEAVAPPVNPKIEEAVQPPQQKIAEPDIVMPEKKEAAIKPVEARPEIKKLAPKAVEQVKPKNNKQQIARPDARIAKQQAARAQAELLRQEEQAASEQAARDKQAELAAAKGRVVDEYQAKIRAKIRSNIVMPPGVAKDASAEFLVTLLPGGSVLNAELKKSSGYGAYDNAVERAIFKSDPLPLPPDAQLFSAFRELLLTFKPEKPTE